MISKGAFNTPKILELKRKKRAKIRNKIIIIIVFLFVLFLGICFLTFWEEIQIKEIKTFGNKIIETEKLQKEIEKEIEKPILFFFKKNNFIFLPKNKIEKKLFSKYKRIEKINLSFKSINNLYLEIKERDILYTWCGEEILEEEKFFEMKKCFFVDKNGFVFDEAPYFSEGVYLKLFGKLDFLDKNKEFLNKSLEIENNNNILGKNFYFNNFEKIIKIYNSLKDLELPISSFYLNQEEELEVYLISKYTPPKTPKIIFSMINDLDRQIDNLRIVLKDENFSKLFKEKFELLLYIDLRFHNKVFHKFKQ